MIKNAHIFEEFEKKEVQEREKYARQHWFERANELYEVGLSLNKEALVNGGANHLEMLIQQRKKMKAISKGAESNTN